MVTGQRRRDDQMYGGVLGEILDQKGRAAKVKPCDYSMDVPYNIWTLAH